MRLELDVYGVGVRIEADGAAALAVASLAIESLREDFRHFEAPLATRSPELEVRLTGQAAPSGVAEQGIRLFRTRLCQVRGWGRTRVCDYGDGHVVVAENRSGHRSFVVHGADRDTVYEISYMLLLSTIGEALDRRGYHRVHALGFERNGRTGIVMLPQGAGKSALATLLMRAKACAILSDETPLVRKGRLHPFPVRIALKAEVAAALGVSEPARVFKRKVFPEKNLYSIPAANIGRAAPLECAVAGVAGASPRLLRCSRLSLFVALCANMVVGLGVAQMAEHMLRIDAVFRLAIVAFSRVIEAARVAWGTEAWVFEVGRDAKINAEELQKALPLFTAAPDR